MLDSCTSLSALFTDSIVSDTMAETALLAFEPDRTRSTLLQRVNGTWAYLNTASTDYATVSQWVSANALELPTTTQLTSKFQDGGEYGNVYLTGGELIQFVTYVYTYGALDYVLKQPDDNVAELAGSFDVSATTTVAANAKLVNQHLAMAPNASIRTSLSPFFDHTVSTVKFQNYGRQLYGSHYSKDGINTSNDVAALISDTEHYGDRMCIYWFNDQSSHLYGYNDAGIKVVDSQGTEYGIALFKGPHGTPANYSMVSIFGVYQPNAYELYYAVRYGEWQYDLFVGDHLVWKWTFGSVQLNGYPLIDIIHYTNITPHSTIPTTTFNRTQGSLSASMPSVICDGSIFGPREGSTNLQRERGEGTTVNPTLTWGDGNSVTLTAHGSDFGTTYVTVNNATVKKVSVKCFARRRTGVAVWSQSRPTTRYPIAVRGMLSVDCYLNQTRSSNKYNRPSLPWASTDYIPNQFVAPKWAISLSATASYGDSSMATITATATRVDYQWTKLIYDALTLCDGFNADDILKGGDIEKLKTIIGEKYSTMDAYMAMYADYTANLVVDSIVNAMITSLVTGRDEISGYDEEGNPIITSYRYPMERMYGFDDDTIVTVSGHSFSCHSLRESNDQDTILSVCTALYQLQKDMDYKLTLFMEMHDAFNGVDAMSAFADRIRAKIDSLRAQASLIMNARGVSSEALLLNCAAQESVYTKVQTVISNAIAAGYSTLSDAVNYISKVVPELGYNFTKDSVSAELYESILSKTNYANYKSNILNPPKELDSNVSYWKTYQLRLGSSVLGQASPDAEFTTASDGSLYLWPPLVTTIVRSSTFDVNIDAGQFFYVPLKYSYLIVRRMTGNQYGIDWAARFAGGNDSDLYSAIKLSLEEFFETAALLATVYAGTDVSVAHDELPEGYVGQAQIDNVVGSLTLMATGALSGVAAAYGVGGSDSSTQLPNGKVTSLKAAGAGGIIGLAAGSIISLSQSIWPDYNGVANTNWSSSALVSTARSPEFLNSITISGYAPLESSGTNAVNNMASVMLWALRYGLIAPVGDYASASVGVGVFSPSYVVPKYYYIGEHTDYSALAITAGVAITAVYTARYFRLNKVRTAEFIPATIAGGAVTAAGSIISSVASEDVASESDIMTIANMVSGGDGQSVYDRVDEIDNRIGSEDDYKNALIGGATAGVTVLGVLGSIASLASLTDESVAEVKSRVEKLGTKNIYRY